MVATDRSLGGRRLTSTGNQIVNNIIADQGKPILSEDPEQRGPAGIVLVKSQSGSG